MKKIQPTQPCLKCKTITENGIECVLSFDDKEYFSVLCRKCYKQRMESIYDEEASQRFMDELIAAQEKE